MLNLARYRCLFYILTLIAAYIAMEALGGERLHPWRSHRMVFAAYVDSLDSTDFYIVESTDTQPDDGIYVLMIQINVIESPVYYSDEISFPSTKSNLIEIGRQVEVRRGYNFTEAASNASVDFKVLRSTDFLRATILNAVNERDLTHAMEHTIQSSPSLGGKVLNHPRLIVAMISNLLWVLGWFALAIEIVLAHFRRKKNRLRYLNDLCYTCDYQLTRDMTQCPECGDSVNWRNYKPKQRA
jgi:predicted RNA-binding Zn-ribbon protein involved in translation (DUF1610 family)